MTIGVRRLAAWRLACLGAVVLASGCATTHAPAPARIASAPAPVRDCARWFHDLDAVVDRAGVRDARPWRVPGFPYLRLDRFTASFAQAAARDPRTFRAWVERARRLDGDARRVEIGNLPARDLAGLHVRSRRAALGRIGECAAVLEAHDLATPAERAHLVSVAVVPDGYETWARTIGLYPVLRIPFARGIDAWHAEAVAAFRRFARGELPAGTVTRYVPPPAPRLSSGEVAALVARGRRDPLGIPDLGAAERARLFATFAPVVDVQTGGDFDRIGALEWASSPTPRVDVARPTVYRRLAFTRYDGATLPQLVYTMWFSERPGASAFDPLAGRLDGLVFRVTIGADGKPLVYDSIHPCGCYHMFLPTARVRVLPSPRPGDEWAFVPASAPALAPGQRIRIFVASRTHYLSGVGVYDAGTPGAAATGYALADAHDLLALPLPAGGTRSIFGPDGLVAGTERPERWLFWPMGVPSAGTMRQWDGRDTAFLGERHFDDAYLIERRFRIVRQ